MFYPTTRLRRLRGNKAVRAMVRETHLRVEDLIYPVFVTHGKGIKQEVKSMPGVYNFSIDNLIRELEDVVKMGIPAIILFGIPLSKDGKAAEAYDPKGIIQLAVRAVKDEYPDLIVITDVCLCEYTDHGHCGLVEDGKILNDQTLELLTLTALSHVDAGADIVAPSDMMDGRVQAIRKGLDTEGFQDIPIMAYSAKYSSAFYGPFRDAAGSAPQFGDRKTYQMDPANAREALREVELDIGEGADIVMVKPALSFMDIIWRVKESFGLPVAVYNVSGEYSMIKAAALNGWLDEKATVMEVLTGMKRAGADMILTYHAKDAVKWIGEA